MALAHQKLEIRILGKIKVELITNLAWFIILVSHVHISVDLCLVELGHIQSESVSNRKKIIINFRERIIVPILSLMQIKTIMFIIS